MTRLLFVAVVIVPATLWYAAKIGWAVFRGGPRAGCVCDSAPRAWARWILRAAGVTVELENEELIDPDRPQVLVANHVSWFDVLALAAFTPGRYAFVAKKEIRRVPVFGSAVGKCGHIYIDRTDRARAVESLAHAKQRLEESAPTVIMFPEGTRSASGRLQPFKRGAFVLAIQTGASVVPAAISGSRRVMRKGSFLITPGVVRIRFGEPIPVDGYGIDDRGTLTSRAWEALAGLQEHAEGRG